jgi:plastocyanin
VSSSGEWRRHLRVALAATAIVGVLAACGDDEGDDAGVESSLPPATATPVGTTGVSHTVQALDNTFRTETIEVAVGDEVVFDNVGRNEHNVVPVEGDAWGVDTSDFLPGDTYAHVFTEPGEYPYYCSLHGTTTAGMIGKVVVAP